MIEKPSACSSCSMCCRHLAVEEIAKPAAQWCQHAKPGKGCGIYATRPPSCHDYECVWLSLYNKGTNPPLSLRPDHSKVIIDVQGNEVWYVARVSKQYKDHWRKPEVLKVLETIVDTVAGSSVFLVVDGGPARPILYKNRPIPLNGVSNAR